MKAVDDIKMHLGFLLNARYQQIKTIEAHSMMSALTPQRHLPYLGR
jgi:hypothetical protein